MVGNLKLSSQVPDVDEPQDDAEPQDANEEPEEEDEEHEPEINTRADFQALRSSFESNVRLSLHCMLSHPHLQIDLRMIVAATECLAVEYAFDLDMSGNGPDAMRKCYSIRAAGGHWDACRNAILSIYDTGLLKTFRLSSAPQPSAIDQNGCPRATWVQDEATLG